MLLIDNLEKIGLSKREAEIYMALLKKKEFTAPELASITTVPRTKVYDILQNLENKGLCTGTQKDNRKKYRAIGPNIAFQNVLSEDEIKLNKKREIAKQLGEELQSLFEKNNSENNPLDYIEILTDKNQIHERWVKYQRNAKNEIVAFTKGPYSTLLYEANLDDEFDALTKDVRIRSIYEYGDMTDKDHYDTVGKWISHGEDARLVAELPVKMVIFDNKTTMIALNDPISLKPSLTTMVINHPGYAKTMKYIFESIWEKAIPFEEFYIQKNI